MNIQWQWVIAAFLAGITLTLCLELRRRWQLGQVSSRLYILPVATLLLTGGFWFIKPPTAAPSLKTAVTPLVPQPTAIATLYSKSLPPPQISQLDSTPLPTPILVQQEESGKTAVHQLHIPALKLSKPIKSIPLENGEWNISALGSDVGWLETTAPLPNGAQPMVFVGHMTFANQNLLEEGAFADIPTLSYGSAIVLETETELLTYRVDSVRRVLPDQVEALYEDTGDTILLLTCADWDPWQGIYKNRLLVRASRTS
jgi:LPXTG-site transpeptidase (sortase) family protein